MMTNTLSDTQKTNVACTAPLYMRILTLVIAIVGYVIILTMIDKRVTELSLIFWTYMLIRMQLISPDLVVHDTGVEINRYGFKTFLRWQDIQGVRVSRLNSQIFPATIPRWLRVIVYDSLLINVWRENYKVAMELIEERSRMNDQQTTQRVYE